jgi:hypothetical protein
MRRAGTGGVPLAPAVVGHADRAGGPRLGRNVPDHVVDGLALAARDRVPCALGAAGSGYVHGDVGEAVVEVELDGPVLDEREHWVRRRFLW